MEIILKRRRKMAFLAAMVFLLSTILADLTGSGITASAAVFGDFFYSVKNGYVTIAKYNWDAAEVVVPETIEGKRVTAIGEEAFKNCTSIVSITLPDNVRKIEGHAFSGCTNLTSITLPHVTSIEQGAFYNCTSLSSIELPDSLTSLGAFAFSGCTSLKSLTVPKNTALSTGAFNESAITNLVIQGDRYTAKDHIVIDNEHSCISAYGSPESITIPYGVTSISSSAFENCTSCLSITIPDSVTSIGGYAFWGCDGLKSLTIPNSVTFIGGHVFRDCTGLTSVTLPDSVTSIGISTFWGCTSLTSIDIPENVASIDDYAFYNCENLTLVTIGSNVTSIGDFAFYGCKNVAFYGEIGSYAQKYAQKNAIPFFNADSPEDVITYKVEHGSAVITGYTGADTELVIPAEIDGYKVTGVESSAFDTCNRLKSVTISEGITTIGESAFDGCENLESVGIPRSVTSIGDEAFGHGFSYGVIRSDLIILCYEGTAGEKYAKDNGFAYIQSNPDFQCEIKNGAVVISDYTGTDTAVEIPGTVKMFNRLVMGDKLHYSWDCIAITGIGKRAFYENETLTALTIPESVTTIGNAAFNLSGLTSLTINGNQFSVSGQAVVDHTNNTVISAVGNPTNVVIPSGVTTVGSQAFLNCTAASSITMPDTVASIADEAFAGCTAVTEVTIPDSVTAVGRMAFYDFKNLKSITIPKSVTAIGERAFGYVQDSATSDYKKMPDFTINCYSGSAGEQYAMDNGFDYTLIQDLSVFKYEVNNGTAVITGYAGKETNVVIPAEIDGYKVTEIGESAFFNNSRLTAVTIPDGVTTIGDGAFAYCEGITSLTIPDSVTSIGNAAFRRSGITRLTNKGNNFSLSKNVVVDNANKRVISSVGNPTSVVIPDGVTSIAAEAFTDCTELQSVTIPDSVKTIAYSAFSDCTALTAITIPNGVTDVKWGTFYGCTKLSEVKIPDSVTSVGMMAFYGCTSLKSVTIPKSVTSIEEKAFGYAFSSDTWEDEKLPGFKIFCYKGTAGEQYAVDNGFAYTLLGEHAPAAYGDVDGQEGVTASDALLILKFVVRLDTPTEAQTLAADVDESGSVDATDALLVLKKVVKLIEKFPIEEK